VATRIGLIAEGPIDRALLDPLLSRIADEKVGFTWPVDADDMSTLFPIRKRGHGGVLKAVQALVRVLDEQFLDFAFFVIVLDRRTRPVQEAIRRHIAGKEHRFVVGVAIEEIEAWWLADRTNTLAWAGLSPADLPAQCAYARSRYRAERDPTPKNTLDEITRISDRLDRYYGHGSVDLAVEFGEEYWRNGARLDDMCGQCPNGFHPFQRRAVNAFRRGRAASGRLL